MSAKSDAYRIFSREFGGGRGRDNPPAPHDHHCRVCGGVWGHDDAACALELGAEDMECLESSEEDYSWGV